MTFKPTTCCTKKMAEQNLLKMKGSKSVVWNYFGLQANENGVVLQEVEDEPMCRTCKKSVRAKSGNTSNLLPHLRDIMPIFMQRLLKVYRVRVSLLNNHHYARLLSKAYCIPAILPKQPPLTGLLLLSKGHAARVHC